METRVSSLGQGPGLAWKRSTSSFPPGSLAELQEWTGGKTEPPEPPWHGDLTFQQWNTVGWAITNDGVLCIKPWEGNTGETGPLTTGIVPWVDQESNIKKIESTGTIVLNEDSQTLFFDCSNLTDLTGLAGWSVYKVTGMGSMFSKCSSLTDLTGLEDWNVSNVTDMSAMFYDCSGLTDLTALTHWTASNVMDMSGMFSDCSGLTDLTGLSGWDVSNVTDMSGMFYDCSSLTDLTALAHWNVSNVENMSAMFYYCYSLQKIGIPSIANGGQKLVENAESSGIADAMPTIISEDESMGPLRWDDLRDEMSRNPDAFQEGTIWLTEVR